MGKRRRPYRRFAFAGIAFTLATAAGLAYATNLGPVAIYAVALSLATFLLCAYDKKVAGTEAMRVPERVLLGAALVGGTLGLLVGMKVFRHKTRKASFKRGVVLVILAQLGLGYAAYKVELRPGSWALSSSGAGREILSRPVSI